MLELTKVSTTKAHKLFQMLKKLQLFHDSSYYQNVDDVYSAWTYAQRYELRKLNTPYSKPDK